MSKRFLLLSRAEFKPPRTGPLAEIDRKKVYPGTALEVGEEAATVLRREKLAVPASQSPGSYDGELTPDGERFAYDFRSAEGTVYFRRGAEGDSGPWYALGADGAIGASRKTDPAPETATLAPATEPAPPVAEKAKA